MLESLAKILSIEAIISVFVGWLQATLPPIGVTWAVIALKVTALVTELLID